MLNGYVGCTLGINFPVLTRAAFGPRGSYFAVFVRGVVACIWFGTQSFQGGQCLAVMIGAVWPSFPGGFPNHISASAHVTSAELLCFFLFVLVQLPLLWLRVGSLRWMFMAKTVVMPVFGVALFTWAVVAGKGVFRGYLHSTLQTTVNGVSLTSPQQRASAQRSPSPHTSQTATPPQ